SRPTAGVCRLRSGSEGRGHFQRVGIGLPGPGQHRASGWGDGCRGPSTLPGQGRRVMILRAALIGGLLVPPVTAQAIAGFTFTAAFAGPAMLIAGCAAGTLIQRNGFLAGDSDAEALGITIWSGGLTLTAGLAILSQIELRSGSPRPEASVYLTALV